MLLVNALGDTPLRVVMQESTDDPRQMWRKLESRYASTTETAHLTVSSNLANKKLQPGGNIITFMGELESLYDRLESMGETTSDRMKIAKLLNSLPDEYDSLSAALRTQTETSRTWNDVQDLFQEEYERLEQNRSSKGGKASKVLYTKEQRKNVICHKCGKKGHIKKYCRSVEEAAEAEGESGGKTDTGSDKGSGSRVKAKKVGSTRVKLLMARSSSASDGTCLLYTSPSPRD